MPYVNPKVANPLHSRAARDLKLDKFAADNLTNRDLIKRVELDDGFFVQGKNYVEADEPGELLLGCLNYVELMREIHPYDIGEETIGLTLEHSLDQV